MSWLKAASEKINAPKYSLADSLAKKLRNFQAGRSRETLHASELTKPEFCPRQQAFLDLEQVQKYPGNWVPAALQVTFDVGKETARMLIEEWCGDIAYGNWKCLKCGACRTMTTKPKTMCHKSGECVWNYVEVRVESECGASGGIDLLADLGAPKLLVVELKIINPEDFEKIVAPLPEHRIRTNMYLRFWADSNSPYKESVNLHEGLVFYVSRGYGKKNPACNDEILPFKEFKVKRDDDVLKPYLQKATQLKVFRSDGRMPSGICNTALDKHAKSCKSCQNCFSGKYPSQQEALL